MFLRKAKYKINFIKGFTLTELLIAIAVLAVIAGGIVVAINPGELLAQARDSNRIAELNSLNKAIALHSTSVIGGFRGDPNIIYISLPSASSSCVGLSLPALPAGWSYRCVTEANLRRVDGSGWLPINLNALPGGSPFTHLPIDPINSAVNTLYFAYTRGSAGYSATVLLESIRHGRTALEDGGNDLGRFEVGTDLSLWSRASGLVGYWPFTGTGTVLNNQTIGLTNVSHNANHGIALNANATGMAFVAGQVGQALNFDGVDDFVNVSHTEIQNTVFGNSTVFTLEAWAFPSAWANWAAIINKARGACWGHTTNGMWASDQNGFACAMGSGVAPAECNPAGSIIMVAHRPPLNTWNHIICTADGTNLIMHVNGREIGRTAIAGLTHPRTVNTEPLILGRRTSGAGPSFSGNIDEVRIYNRALSASEVRANFNAGRR